MPIKLPAPNTIVPILETNPKFTLLYGSPKIGKTSIIASLKDSYLLIEIDPHGSAYFSGTKIDCSSLEELQEIMNAIIEANYPYKYIVIDTITKFADWMEDFATFLYKKSNLGKNFDGSSVIGELPKGAGYFWLRRAFCIWFEQLKTLGPRIIFIGHLKDSALTSRIPDSMGNLVSVERVGLDEVSTLDLDLTGKLKQIVCAQMDAIGYIYRKTIVVDKKPASQLRVNFNAGASVLGGSRCGHLRGQDFEFDWDRIFLEDK